MILKFLFRTSALIHWIRLVILCQELKQKLQSPSLVIGHPGLLGKTDQENGVWLEVAGRKDTEERK